MNEKHSSIVSKQSIFFAYLNEKDNFEVKDN